MPPQALKLAQKEMKAGAIVRVRFPSGPTTVRVPPVKNRKLLKVNAADGYTLLRVRRVRSTAGKISQGLGALFIGLAALLGPMLIVVGAMAGPPNPNVTPTCHGNDMSPGDTCQITTQIGADQEVTDYTYTQMQASEADSGHSTISAGILLTAVEAVGGGVTVALIVRSRNKPLSLTAAPVAAGGGAVS